MASLEREASLARELKQAVIARAVTRGLDPNTPMRYSGIPWIGQVPKGWEVRRAKSYLDILSGYPFDSGNFTTDKSYMPLIRIRDITSGRAETYYKGDYPKEFVIDNDDLLVGMDGDFNVRWWTGGKALLNQRCCKIMTKDPALDRRFVYYVLPILLQDINRQTYATTVKHLSTFDIYGAKIPYPPLPEQRAIAGYLDARCAAIDAYVSSLEREAALARELKQREIADAVTGKVKITA